MSFRWSLTDTRWLPLLPLPVALPPRHATGWPLLPLALPPQHARGCKSQEPLHSNYTPADQCPVSALWRPTSLQRPCAFALVTPADHYPCVFPLAPLSDAYLPPAGTRAVTYCGRLLASSAYIVARARSPCTLHASRPVPCVCPLAPFSDACLSPCGYTRRNPLWAAACLQKASAPTLLRRPEPLHSARQQTSAPVPGPWPPPTLLQRPCALALYAPADHDPCICFPGALQRRVPTPSGYTRRNLQPGQPLPHPRRAQVQGLHPHQHKWHLQV